MVGSGRRWPGQKQKLNIEFGLGFDASNLDGKKLASFKADVKSMAKSAGAKVLVDGTKFYVYTLRS